MPPVSTTVEATPDPALARGATPAAWEIPLPRRAPGTFREYIYRGAAGTRPYKLFVPGGPLPTPPPLLVLLHGCKQTPDDFATGTRMNDHAQRLGMVVCYPAQSRSHNIARCWNWFRPTDQVRGVGEPAIIAGLTEQVIRDCHVDASRVYIAGLSAGGAMALILADAYPEIYAAVGVHSGVAPGIASGVHAALAVMRDGGGAAALGADALATPPSALPIIVFHGDADPTVHVQNGIEACARSIRALARHGEVLHQSVEPRTAPAEHPCTRTTWTRGNGDVYAELWIVHATGHAWFGGDVRGSYTDPVGPDASARLLEFLLAHRAGRAT